MLAGQAESAPQDNSQLENEPREPPEPAPGIATGRREAGEEEKMKQEGPSLTLLSSDGSSRLPGRDGPGTRRRAPGAARASRSCFVTRTGPHPAAPGAEPRPGLSSRAAIQPAPSPNSGLAAPARPPLPALPANPAAPHLPDAAGFRHGELLLLLGSLHRDFDDPRLGGGAGALSRGVRRAATPRGTLGALRHGGGGTGARPVRLLLQAAPRDARSRCAGRDAAHAYDVTLRGSC